MTRPARVLLIGIDAAVPGRWRRFAESGLLPVGRRLLAEGRFARALPALPTLTTTNWATIATGAFPGTHGVTDFNPHRSGDLPGCSPQGFDARAVTAEFVWEAAARGGRRSIVVNWPGSWPPRDGPPADAAGEGRGLGLDGAAAPSDIVIVGGAGIELNEWRIDVPGRDRLVALAAEQRFSTRPERGGARVALPADGEPFELRLAFDAAYDAVTPGLSLVCRIVARSDGPVARFSLPGAPEALAELAPGEWSERLILPFEVNGQTVSGAFRLKLLALEPGAGLFRLYVTDICRLTWLERPAGVLGDPARFAGLPTPGVGWESYSAGLIDLETFVELTDMATRWLADVCADLVAHEPCDLLCTHFHAVDSFYHLCLEGLSEVLTPDAAGRRRFERAEQVVYRQVDAAVGRILETAGNDVLTVLVSDHGVVPLGRPVPLAEILSDAGLLATLGSDADGAGSSHTIDWTRSLAVPQGSCFIRVNEAGREPHGIVDPADAPSVRGRVIDALLDYRDPVTDLCPFSLVVPREDAAGYGLRCDGVGDVVYALRPEFSEVHGSMLPDAVLSEGDWGMPAMCLFSGAGAATGADLEGFVSLVDVAPTVCRALSVAPPADSDGVVRADLLAPELATSADR